MSMNVQPNSQIQVSQAAGTFSHAAMNNSSKGIGSAPSSLATFYSTKNPPASTDDNKGWVATALSYPKKAWDALVNFFKNAWQYCCGCFKSSPTAPTAPAAPAAPVEGDMGAFHSLVKTKDVKAEDVKAAFEKLSETQREKITDAIISQGKAEGEVYDAEEAEEAVHNNEKILSKALDRMVINKELVAFNKAFKAEGVQSSQIRVAFEALGTVAQQELITAVANGKSNPHAFNAKEFIVEHFNDDVVEDAVQDVLKKYKI